MLSNEKIGISILIFLADGIPWKNLTWAISEQLKF
jgi:hypothetical protein